MDVGFIGAGRMGRPMIGRLGGAGHDVRVLVRSPEAQAAATAAGARPVDDVAAVADGAQAVVVCVLTDGQVRDVVLESGLLEQMPEGALLVTHTTGSPATVQALADRAGPRGIDVVDAPVSGGPADIEGGGITLYVGAGESGFVRARPLLSAYGDPILHVGPRGSGQVVKLLNNAVFAANIGIVAQAVRLADELGLNEQAVLAGIGQGSGASRALAAMGAFGSVATFAGAVGEFLGKDVAVVNRVVAELGLDLGVMDPPHRLLAEMLAPEHRALLLEGR